MTNTTTALIHHPYEPPEGFGAPQPGVFKASTVFFPNVAAMHAREWKHKTSYTYGLHGTPTTYTLEARLATLEGGLYTLLVPSGLAAITLVNFALLKTGDELLLPANVYGPSKVLAEGELANFGVSLRFYDPMNAADLAAKITPKTKLVWLEAAGSVTMEFPDLLGLVRACRERGVVCALDNTWGAGLAFNAFDLTPGTNGSGGPMAVDITIHALTKYPSGGGDVLMGSVTTRDSALRQRLTDTHMRTGVGVGVNDVEMVLRSLPSMAIRYAAHDAVARTLARWLRQRPEIAQLLHPAIEGCPGYAHWQAVCGHHGADQGSAAGLFSVVFDERITVAQVERFCDSLKLFKLGYSWGGPVSLVVPYNVPAMRGAGWLHKGVLVRFSVGLEAAEDLQADLAQALATLQT